MEFAKAFVGLVSRFFNGGGSSGLKQRVSGCQGYLGVKGFGGRS